MEILILVVFVLGYTFIALEHPVHIDKAATALITGVVSWGVFVLGADVVPAHLMAEFTAFSQNYIGDPSIIQSIFYEHRLLHHMEEIASILFFLMGAMTIVELVDAHEGFAVITDRIKTKNKVKLLWIIGVLTFFFSAALDNLTTTIVMISLLRKLIEDKETRWFYVGMVVVAANAGGAWSPIGDVPRQCFGLEISYLRE
jgi:Na+/H+ antiporter NhaD/arsenite permease-like protein